MGPKNQRLAEISARRWFYERVLTLWSAGTCHRFGPADLSASVQWATPLFLSPNDALENLELPCS